MRSLDIPLADTFVDTMSGLIVECKKRIFSEALDPASVNPHFATLRNAFNLTVHGGSVSVKSVAIRID